MKSPALSKDVTGATLANVRVTLTHRESAVSRDLTTALDGRFTHLDPTDVAEVVRRYPRLNFKRSFNELLNHELDSKQSYQHWFHICSRIAHNRSPLTIVDAPTVLSWAPFDE